MKDLWEYLKNCDKPIVLYGTGNGADKILARLTSDGVQIAGIFASDGFVRQRQFAGFTVESYSQIEKRLGDFVVLVSFGSSRPEVISNILRIRQEHELYAPDVPVCGGEIFDAAFYEKHAEEIAVVTALLGDAKSRGCMECTVRNKLSGDIEYLLESAVSEDEIFALLPPSPSVFFDLGAYNGDTVLQYRKVFPSIETVVAVEPDAYNFRRLSRNIGNAELVNAVIGDSSGVAHISKSRGRGTVASGDLEIPRVCVDDLVDRFNVVPDLIKFDIEGAEVEGIRGAKRTISENKPAMRIACYHKSADIFEIPQAVLALRPDYKVYMRHLLSVPGWDIDFIFV